MDELCFPTDTRVSPIFIKTRILLELVSFLSFYVKGWDVIRNLFLTLSSVDNFPVWTFLSPRRVGVTPHINFYLYYTLTCHSHSFKSDTKKSITDRTSEKYKFYGPSKYPAKNSRGRYVSVQRNNDDGVYLLNDCDGRHLCRESIDNQYEGKETTTTIVEDLRHPLGLHTDGLTPLPGRRDVTRN